VASAVASGLADAGVTTEPAALAYSLDFIPWQEELSELHIPRSLVGSLEVRALLDVLAGRELPAQLAALDGYDAAPAAGSWRHDPHRLTLGPHGSRTGRRRPAARKLPPCGHSLFR